MNTVRTAYHRGSNASETWIGRWLDPHAPKILRWLVAILLAIITEGGLRKWVLPPGWHGAAFVAKDVLAVAFCWRYPLKSVRPVFRRLGELWLLVGVLLIVPLLVGAGDNWQSAVITYKNAVIWPLFAFHAAARITSQDIKAFSKVLVWIAAAMACLALFQYRSSPDSWVNGYAWDAVGVRIGTATMGEGTVGTRAAGTFSYITGLTAFSVATFTLMIWRIAAATVKSERRWAIAGLLAAVCCGVTAGGRSAIAFFLVSTTLTLSFSRTLIRTLKTVSLIGLVLAAFVGFIAPDAVQSLYERAMGTGDTVQRITGEGFKANPLQLIAADPVGIGLGQFGGFANLQRMQTTGTYDMAYEDRATEAVYEGGILGWGATWIVTGACAWLAFKGLSSQDRNFRLYTAASAVAALYAVSTCVWYDHNATALYWLVLSLWLALWPPGRSKTRQAQRFGKAAYDGNQPPFREPI